MKELLIKLLVEHPELVIAALSVPGFLLNSLLSAAFQRIPLDRKRVVIRFVKWALQCGEKFVAEQEKQDSALKSAAAKNGVIGAGIVFLALAVSGCAVSLEQTKQQGIIQRLKAGTGLRAMSQQGCDRLDSIQQGWQYAYEVTAPVAPLAAGIAAVPGVDGGAQNALLVTAGVAAAVTVFEYAEQQNFQAEWVKQGCAQ